MERFVPDGVGSGRGLPSMRSFGPGWLHRPLPRITRRSAIEGVRWIKEGLSLLAPIGLRYSGLSPRLVLANAGAGGGIEPAAAIEESWLGVRRLSDLTTACADLPIEVELSADDLYTTVIDLPAAASHDPAAAVLHRLDSLSPLPRDRVSFAVGRSRDVRAGRAYFPVAVARQSVIESILQSPHKGRISSIGALRDPSGRPEFEFYRSPLHWRGVRRALSPFVALALSVIVFTAGLFVNLGRRIQAMSAYEDQLLHALRAERAALALIADMPRRGAGIDVGGLYEAVEALVASSPEKVWFEEIRLSGGEVRARGYAIEGAIWPPTVTPALRPAGRQEIVSFELGQRTAAAE